MKKILILAVILFTFSAVSSAAEKKDTVVSNQNITTQQNFNKGLAKQTKVTPRKQSNWARIKDLFM